MYVCVGDQWDSHEESEEGCGGATRRPLSDSKLKDEDRYLQLLHMYTHFDFNLCLQISCMYAGMYVLCT